MSTTSPDPFLEELKRTLANEDEIYYRWSLVESQDDMSDVMFFFMSTYSPAVWNHPHSGRYGKIFLKEIDSGSLVTI